MISEYFSVRDRPLNYVKKPSSFVEFDKIDFLIEIDFFIPLPFNKYEYKYLEN